MTYKLLESKFFEILFAASIVVCVLTVLFISTLRIKSFTDIAEWQELFSRPTQQLVVASNGEKNQ